MTLQLPPVDPGAPTMPPLRPGWLTRLANRIGVRRVVLVRAVIATIVGAPVVGTAVLLATVPVPQSSAVPFEPATSAPAAPDRHAAEPGPETPSPRPAAALTAPGRAPRVIAPTEARRPSRTATAADGLAGLQCPELIALGHHDIPRGDPLYTPARDREGDGIACETRPDASTAPTATESAPATKPAQSTTVEPSPTARPGGDVP